VPAEHQTLYYLPDGTQVMLNKEKILAPEILFQPDRVGLEYQGIHEMVISSIKRCDIEMRKALYGGIVLAGGTTLMHGFGDRMHKSIQKLAPKDMKVTITNPGNRQHTCWIGGSTISSLKAFSRYWVTKRQYEEEGGYRALLVQSM
jgi:centractin